MQSEYKVQLKRKRAFSQSLTSAGNNTLASSTKNSALIRPSFPPDFQLSSSPDLGRARCRPVNALSVVKLSLSLTESFVESIPMVGPPIKAAIEGILKIIELFNVRDKNKKHVSRLVRKLKDLDKRMEWAKVPHCYGEMKPHLEDLTQQLENLHKTLIDLYSNSTSIINGESVADDLRECEDSIDELLSNYNFSATMNIEDTVSTLLLDVNVLHGLIRKNVQTASLHSPFEAAVTFIDARGIRVPLSLALCSSFQDFQRCLDAYFSVGNTTFPKPGRNYVESGQYMITYKNREVSARDDQDWSRVLESGGPLEMSIGLPNYPYTSIPFSKDAKFSCFRCDAPIPARNTTDDGNFSCQRCDLMLRTSHVPIYCKTRTNAEDLQVFKKFCVVRVVDVPRCEHCDKFNEICVWTSYFQCETCRSRGLICHSSHPDKAH